MSYYSANIDDFGIDSRALAGSLETRLQAIRDVGFTQVALGATDLINHPHGLDAAVQAVLQFKWDRWGGGCFAAGLRSNVRGWVRPGTFKLTYTHKHHMLYIRLKVVNNKTALHSFCDVISAYCCYLAAWLICKCTLKFFYVIL